MFATEPQTQTEDQPPTLAEIVREVTDNGRTIINFLHDVMLNRVEDAKMCHRIAAARELAKLGSKEAEEFLKAVTQSGNGRAPARASGKSPRNDELADIIKQETSDGRDVVRFLVDVMHGNLDGFKPCHRVASAKELLRRGFDNAPSHSDDGEYEYEDHDESIDDDDPRTPEQRDPGSPNYVGRYAHLHNNEDDPFDFDNYDREQFWRDGWGGRALRHIYGGKEAASVAHDAVAEHRRKTMFDGHIPDRDYTPIENPDDDPYGKGHYGYNAIRFVFGDNQAIRVANKAVEEFKKRKAEHSEGESENEGPPVDRPSCCFPKPTAPSSIEEDDTLPPDHWSIKYMERLRNRSIETDESSKDPVPPLSVTPERPQNPPVGAGFKPARGLAHPSTDRDSERPDVILERPPVILERPPVILERSEEPPAPSSPPRKRPVKIFLGPPDENPRQCRDSGDFHSIWSAGVF